MSLVEPGMIIDKSTRRDVLALYGRATIVDPQSYRAWHQWGLSNYRAIEESRSGAALTGVRTDDGPQIQVRVCMCLFSCVCLFGFLSLSLSHTNNLYTPCHLPLLRTQVPPTLLGHNRISRQIIPSLINVPVEVVAPLAVNATKGLLRAIALGAHQWSSSITQDMLCVLSIWFRFGRIPDVCAALEVGLSSVHLDNWLGVLPQLIARIDHPDPTARSLLHALLVRLGVVNARNKLR